MPGMARRFRFSIRTLAIVVSLVCAYVGSWPLTAKYGVPQQIPQVPRWATKKVYLFNADSPAPLIIRQDVVVFEYPATIQGLKATDFKRQYYLWLGVTKIRLPYESSWDDREIFDSRMGFRQTTVKMLPVDAQGKPAGKPYVMISPY